MSRRGKGSKVKSLTAAVILLAHAPEFVTELETSLKSKRENASDLRNCIARVKYFALLLSNYSF